MQLDTFLGTASMWVLPVVLAITLHEAAHGFVAHWEMTPRIAWGA